MRRNFFIMLCALTLSSESADAQVFGSETKQEIPEAVEFPRTYLNATYLDAGSQLLSINYERSVGENLAVRIGVALSYDNLIPERAPLPAMVNFFIPILDEQFRAEIGLGLLFAVGFDNAPGAPIGDLRDTSQIRSALDEANPVSLNGYPAASFGFRIEPHQNNVLWRVSVMPISSPVGLRWNFSASVGFRF